jgi:hypothetical protein
VLVYVLKLETTNVASDDDALLLGNEHTCCHCALSTEIRENHVSEIQYLRVVGERIAWLSCRSHDQTLRPTTTCAMRRRKATHVDDGFLDHICENKLASTPRTHLKQAEACAT